MKLFLLFTMLSFNVYASESCTTAETTSKQDVVYEVNTNTPKHLQGATITVTLADGTKTTVPAEKFMVVPRKQYTKLGESTKVSAVTKCSKSAPKNILMAEVRKDVKKLESSTEVISGGKKVTVTSEKDIIPGVNYYRRELLDNVGAGVGVDTNGTVKGMVGFDF